MESLYVRMTRKNRDMETVSEEEYPLQDFVELMRQDLQRVITDVESLVYHTTNKPREEWDDETWAAFTRIRHRLLDKAGDIGRLPEYLVSR